MSKSALIPSTLVMKRNGFTLIELVMVIVLIGILAVIAAPKLPNITTTNAGAFADKLRADIRYAQDLAMARGLRYRVYFNAVPAPAQGYAVVNDANGNGTWGEAGEIASDPAGSGNLTVTLNTGNYAGITISVVGFTGSYVEFNSLGVPFDGGGVLAAAKSVTATGGTANWTVTVQAQTGAVN
jgi:MSHA pilin protein MshC